MEGCGKETKRYKAFIGWTDVICGVADNLCDDCSLNTGSGK